MSLILRIVLVVAAIGLLAFLFASIKKSRMRIEDSLFWIGLSLLIFLISIFPQIPTALSSLFGFLAPVNFIFLFFIFVLLLKVYFTSKHVSELDTRVKELTQQLAIDRLDHYERTNVSKRRICGIKHNEHQVNSDEVGFEE